jgi:hypothetical protein
MDQGDLVMVDSEGHQQIVPALEALVALLGEALADALEALGLLVLPRTEHLDQKE